MTDNHESYGSRTEVYDKHCEFLNTRNRAGGRPVVAGVAHPLSVFDLLPDAETKQIDVILAKAQDACEEKMLALNEALHDEGDWPDDTLAPFCGCVTCEVREMLHVALPHIEEAVLVAWGLQRNKRKVP